MGVNYLNVVVRMSCWISWLVAKITEACNKNPEKGNRNVITCPNVMWIIDMDLKQTGKTIKINVSQVFLMRMKSTLPTNNNLKVNCLHVKQCWENCVQNNISHEFEWKYSFSGILFSFMSFCRQPCQLNTENHVFLS